MMSPSSLFTTTNSKQQQQQQHLLVATTVAIVSSLTTAAVMYGCWRRRQRQQQKHQRLIDDQQQELLLLQQRRQEERTGRIRAEIKLRTALKEIQRLKYSKSGEVSAKNQATDNNMDSHNHHIMVLRAIGTVTSPYTKRMGTPRQAQLVPSSRGFIDFHSSIPAASLDGIDEYSCIWIIFEFHANTDLTDKNITFLKQKTNKRTKIRPPRGGGIKVGQLATRSPHRPNALGLSLVKIEQWDAASKRLYISGLDLVHGTPVYDIKPFVPWDIPGYYPHQHHCPDLKVPSWVSQNDEIAQVTFIPEAARQLEHMVQIGRLAPLYTRENDGYNGALQTLQEVLAQDPRSSHKGLKSNARGTTVLSTLSSLSSSSSSPESAPRITMPNPSESSSHNESYYRLVFGQCQVEFVVSKDGVIVICVASIDFDPDSYVDGVPLLSESQR